MKNLFLIIFFIWIFPLAPVCGESLTTLYFKRPPYYDTVENQPDGFLIKMTQKIFQTADIQPIFIEVPPLRIMYYIKDPEKQACSIGWFKNKEREAFAKFSLPIYQNKPLVVLTTRSNQVLIEKHHTIKDVFSDRKLILAKIDSFSYGSIMDEWINNYAPYTHEISSDQSLLPKLILSNRANYMLVAPEEINMMLTQAQLDTDLFVALSKPDIPAGNKRYIIFSKGVKNRLIERINQAIQALPLEEYHP